MRNVSTKLVEWAYFKNFITLLIVVNFVVLAFSTRGIDTETIELIILAWFALEVALKLVAYRWLKFWKDPWNRFDLFIVIIGILPLIGIPLPAGASGVRALRLLKLVGVVPSFRTIISAIGRSMSDMIAVGGITVFFLAISTLMTTMSFQSTMPEFSDLLTSFGTLLRLAIFDNSQLVGEAWGHSKIGTLIVFPLFYLTVPLMTLNLVIGVLSNALSKDDPRIAEMHATIRSLSAQVTELQRAERARGRRPIRSTLKVRRK